MAARRTLSEEQIIALSEAHPGLPLEYLYHLRHAGWGIAKNGNMIYAAPVEARQIYKDKFHREGILLLGYDFRGYSFGFDAHNQHYGEVGDSGGWEPWPEEDAFRWCTAEARERTRGCGYARAELAGIERGLPERGPICLCCNNHIPKFAELSDEDESTLRTCARERNGAAVMVHLEAIGCPPGWAKLWYLHTGAPARPTPCPACGRPLRSPHAKQCRFCKQDWHDLAHVRKL